MSRQYRVQVPGLANAPALRPAPMQSDTYAPPPRPAVDQNTARLADALGSFSRSIGGLVPTMMAERQKADERALWAQQKKLSGMTREEYVQAVETGTIPVYADEFKVKAIQSAHGMHYGAHRSDQLRQHLMTQFDWDSEDVGAFLASEIRADLDKYGADRNFGAQYLREMDRLQSWAMDYREKRSTEQFVQAQHDAAFAVIDTKVNELIQAGTNPKAIAASVYGWYGELGKDGTLGMDHDALDKEVLNKARRLAGEHPEVALAMLEATRTGRGGQVLSLNTRPDMRDAALGIQATAQRVMADRQEAAFREQVFAGDVGLLEAGNLDHVEDLRYVAPDGTERVISADERRERARETFLSRSRWVAAENREEPVESMAREFHAFRLSGEKHPTVERAVTGIADMANVGMLSDDPEGKEKLKGKLMAYEWLQSESTASLLAYTKEDDRDFAESYLMARRYLKHDDGRAYSDDDALSFAIRSTEVTRTGMPLAASARDEIHAQVRTLATEKGWIWGDNDAEPMNSAIAEQRVVNLAQRFVQLGVKPQRAVKMAGEAVKNTSSVYRGVLLDFQGRDVPDDFAEILDTTIADFAKQQPHVLELNGMKEADIAIAPSSSGSQSGGYFVLVDKETMLPIADESGHHVTVQLRDIRAKSAANAEERKGKTLRGTALQSSISSRGYVEAVDTDGKTYWVDPKTREIVEYSFAEDATAPVWKKTGRRYRKGVLTPVAGGVELQPRGDLGIGAAGRFMWDSTTARGRNYRRAAKYLWGMVPEVKIGDTTVKEGPRFVD